MKSILRHKVYRIVGVTLPKIYAVSLMQHQPHNVVDRAPISVMKLNELREQIEEQQKKINNSEMLGTAVARLKEELRHLKL